MSSFKNAVRSIERELDPLERFFKARDYLDAVDGKTVDAGLLNSLLSDESELTRAEAADFLLVSGGLPFEDIAVRLESETSTLVLPRLWLALALTNPGAATISLTDVSVGELSPFELAFYNAARFKIEDNPYYLYGLCALAFSEDVPASYSSIDLLKIVAADKVDLLQGVAADLNSKQAQNAEKALSLFGVG